MTSPARKGILVTCVFLLALFLGVAAVSAQESPFIPAIVDLSADVEAISQAEVESGEAVVTLSWYIVNVSPGQTVVLEYWRQNGWISPIATREALLPVETREIELVDTLSFAPPTFRLTLLNGRNVLDQRYLTIPYSEPAGEPEITAFASEAQSITQAQLSAGNNRIIVSWAVENRPVLSNLVFEQIVDPANDDAPTQNVELPRATLYVASEGQGAVQPVAPVSGDEVLFRLSLVDVTDGTVLATSDLSIPVGDASAVSAPVATSAATPAVAPTSAAPEATTDPLSTAAPDATDDITSEVLTPEATTPSANANAPVIDLFTVTPATIAAGATGSERNVTMTWSVTNATAVQISEVLPGLTGLTYVQLPPSGSVAVPLPEAATTTVTYILTARAADGTEATAQQVVTIGG